MTAARRGWGIAIAALVLLAVYSLIGVALVTWFISALSVSAFVIRWDYVLPQLIASVIYGIVAAGVAWRWRIAFIAGIALFLREVAGLVLLAIGGAAFAVHWLAIIPPLLGLAGLVGLSVAWPLFWRRGRADAP